MNKNPIFLEYTSLDCDNENCSDTKKCSGCFNRLLLSTPTQKELLSWDDFKNMVKEEYI